MSNTVLEFFGYKTGEDYIKELEGIFTKFMNMKDISKIHNDKWACISTDEVLCLLSPYNEGTILHSKNVMSTLREGRQALAPAETIDPNTQIWNDKVSGMARNEDGTIDDTPYEKLKQELKQRGALAAPAAPAAPADPASWYSRLLGMGGGGELDIQTETGYIARLSIDYEDPIVINTLWINLICGIEENMLHRLFIDINKYKWKGISSYFSKSLGIEGYSNVTNVLIILSFIISCKYQSVDFCEIIKGYIAGAPRTAAEKAAVAAKVAARRAAEANTATEAKAKAAVDAEVAKAATQVRPSLVESWLPGFMKP